MGHYSINHSIFPNHFHREGRVLKTIIMIDPKVWAVALEHHNLNTTDCGKVCSITEGIAQAEKEIGTTGLGQYALVSGKLEFSY